MYWPNNSEVRPICKIFGKSLLQRKIFQFIFAIFWALISSVVTWKFIESPGIGFEITANLTFLFVAFFLDITILLVFKMILDWFIKSIFGTKIPFFIKEIYQSEYGIVRLFRKLTFNIADLYVWAYLESSVVLKKLEKLQIPNEIEEQTLNLVIKDNNKYLAIQFRDSVTEEYNLIIIDDDNDSNDQSSTTPKKLTGAVEDEKYFNTLILENKKSKSGKYFDKFGNECTIKIPQGLPLRSKGGKFVTKTFAMNVYIEGGIPEIMSFERITTLIRKVRLAPKMMSIKIEVPTSIKEAKSERRIKRKSFLIK